MQLKEMIPRRQRNPYARNPGDNPGHRARPTEVLPQQRFRKVGGQQKEEED